MATKGLDYQPITEQDGWHVGENFAITFEVFPDTTVVTGWTVKFNMAATQGGTTVLTLTATVPTARTLLVTTVPASTSALAAGTYFYDLARTDSGFNKVIAYGPVVLLPRVVVP